MSVTVFTIAAAKARLRRGATSVNLFWPLSGNLVPVTKDNVDELNAKLKVLEAEQRLKELKRQLLVTNVADAERAVKIAQQNLERTKAHRLELREKINSLTEALNKAKAKATATVRSTH